MNHPSGAIPLEGFELEAKLGEGGFAEVYRYQQALPKRTVAIKVLRSEVNDVLARARFELEANLMASLSSHPAIVTIYQVGIAEGNRPFLVMEYCAKPNLEQRYLQGPLALAEVLQLTIRLAGAVETAHRAGILHLDIKPGNVLTTDFGWPALTDFGIAQLVEYDQTSEPGLSLPWASPEAVRGQPLSQASDIYSLAATAYTLLAGEPPFGTSEQGQNQLIRRILNEPVAPLAAAEIPQSLRDLWSRGLAKSAADRPLSALEFGRALQSIEQECGLPNTPIDVPDELLDDLERTRASYRRVSDAQPADLDDDTVLSSRSTPTEPDDSTIQVKRKRKTAEPIEDRTQLSARKQRRKATSVPEQPDEPSPVATDPRIVIPKPAEEKVPEGYRIREFTPKTSLRVAPGPIVVAETLPANVPAITEQRNQYRKKRNRSLTILMAALILSGALVVAGGLLIIGLLR